jgi:hypothetical protein
MSSLNDSSWHRLMSGSISAFKVMRVGMRLESSLTVDQSNKGALVTLI